METTCLMSSDEKGDELISNVLRAEAFACGAGYNIEHYVLRRCTTTRSDLTSLRIPSLQHDAQ